MPTTPPLRRGGRPTKDEFNRRAMVLSTRVQPDERAAIERRAAAANLTVSDYLRDIALNGRIHVTQAATLDDLDRNALARIGSNLNQIARVCNATGEVRRAEGLDTTLTELRQILRRGHELGQG